ncbi:Low-density lipoprotein receptor domain class A, partial [Ancylostoma duodenale]
CESGICIAGNLTCDLKPDCNDASDEKNCPPRDCTNTTEFDFPGLVNCEGTTQCILPQWKCDGSNDCWDNSDEKDCSEIVLPVLPGLRPCSADEFTCGRTRSCLPRGWVCDGQKDCADGSDEMDCVSMSLELVSLSPVCATRRLLSLELALHYISMLVANSRLSPPQLTQHYVGIGVVLVKCVNH